MRQPKFSDAPLQYQGKSIRENLEDLLTEAVRKYLDMKDTPIVKPETFTNSSFDDYLESEKLLASQRGQVRMAARAILIWRNSYYKDRVRSAKEIEQEFVRRVKDAG